MVDEKPLLAKHKSAKQALEYVDRHPDWPLDDEGNRVAPLELACWELIARNLFVHANEPDTSVVGSVNRALRAQQVILNRTTGTRRTGTAPAVARDSGVTLVDLTTHAIGTGEQTEEALDD